MDIEIRQTFMLLGQNIPCVFYEPETEKSRIAILVMHSDANYLTFPMGPLMAKRGYRVLCANVEDRFSGLDKKILNVKEAVLALRKIRDISKIVLMGHSGGGTLISAYQNIAENGIKICRGPEKLSKCSVELSDMPPADGIMLLDSNFGIAAMSLFSLDPAVIDENNGQRIDEELNLFNPANGFSPEGSSYPDEFIKKFQKAQGARNMRLVKNALERITVIEQGKGRYADDEPFIIPGAEQGFLNNKLYAQDIRFMSHTRKEWPLLKPDGSIVTEIVRSLRKPENPISLTGSYHEGALITTVRNYLNSYAVRTDDDYGYTEDSVYGIDWASSYSCVPGNISGVSVPLLVMGMTGAWEYLASETIYEDAGSKDKTLVFVEGAGHLFTTATQCERSQGEFGDTRNTTFDYVDKWLSRSGRFL